MGIENFLNKRNASRFSRDAIFNIHELAFDTNFVHHITTYPNLIIILYAFYPLAIYVLRFLPLADLRYVGASVDVWPRFECIIFTYV